MSQEYRHILRIMGADVQGSLKVVYALTQIKGISLSFSNAILKRAGVNPNLRVGFLTEKEIDNIEETIRESIEYGLPPWLFNTRKDAKTGKDTHLISADLVLRTKMNIDKAREIKSWRGYRHAYGLKVRGQRTKTTGRAGKSLGVRKKTLAGRPRGK